MRLFEERYEDFPMIGLYLCLKVFYPQLAVSRNWIGKEKFLMWRAKGPFHSNTLDQHVAPCGTQRPVLPAFASHCFSKRKLTPFT